MSDALILEFKGVTADQYRAVNDLLGLDQHTGQGSSPAGLVSHTGATTADGDLVVFEVWDSQASQAAFMGSALGAALGQVGLPQPARIEWLTLEGYHTH
ncbi:MAG TPA: hypothetical protein VHZ96_21065 [Frankiaceae bacterium]|jgi:hypothetical protein|nr:hypothetical protein [Frankiaceae bacterium]